MRLLLIFCSSSIVEDIMSILDKKAVSCYMNISDVKGVAGEMRRLGTILFPGTADVILTADTEDKLVEVMKDLEGYIGKCDFKVCFKAMILKIEKAYF
ncbi:MAG: hypothetical protein QW561_03030 [Candidatus Aenigmatarchaeota archaeon]